MTTEKTHRCRQVRKGPSGNEPYLREGQSFFLKINLIVMVKKRVSLFAFHPEENVQLRYVFHTIALIYC